MANPANPRRATRVTFPVDSGAIYSVVAAATLRRLGIKPHSRRTFTLADGSQVTREVGDAVFVLNGERGASLVMFGEKGDNTLLGTVSLESLGLMLDPLKRTLRQLPLVVGYRGNGGVPAT